MYEYDKCICPMYSSCVAVLKVRLTRRYVAKLVVLVKKIVSSIFYVHALLVDRSLTVSLENHFKKAVSYTLCC